MEPIVVPSRQVIVPPLWIPGRLPLLPPLPSERARWRRLWREPYIQQAAITAALLTNGEDNVGGTSFVTASVTPGANQLVLAYIAVQRNTAIGAVDPTVTGNGLTWVEVNEVLFDNAATRFMKLHLFRSMGAAPSAGAITFNYGADSFTRAIWGVTQFAGVDTSGANGSGAVVQSATATSGSGGTPTSQTVTLAAFGNANNRPFDVCSHHAAQLKNPEAGYTELHDDFVGTADLSAVSLTAQWHPSTAETTPTFDWATAAGAGSIAIEIKDAVQAGGGVPLWWWWWLGS